MVVPLPPRLAPGRVRATPDREEHDFAIADFAIANFAIANVGARPRFVDVDPAGRLVIDTRTGRRLIHAGELFFPLAEAAS